MNKQESSLLSLDREKPEEAASALLKGLELMAQYHSLGLDNPPLRDELQVFETYATRCFEKYGLAMSKAEVMQTLLEDLREVDEIVNSYQCRENTLIQILLRIQQRKHWLAEHALQWVSRRLRVPLSRIYQIVSFYEAFSLEPQGAYTIHVCVGTACHVRGASQLVIRVKEVLGIEPGQTDSELLFTLKTVHCLGCCALGPVMKVGDNYHSNPSTEEIEKIIAACKETEEQLCQS